MKITKNLGMLLLAIYLIVVGVGGLIGLPLVGLIAAVLAIAAGILILIGR
jgi:hypothetical protein